MQEIIRRKRKFFAFIFVTLPQEWEDVFMFSL